MFHIKISDYKVLLTTVARIPSPL